MSNMTLTVVPLTNPQQWQRWQTAWDDLLENSTSFEARIFLSYEWLKTWWQHLGQGQLLVLLVVDKNRPVAAAPFFVIHSPLLPLARLIRSIGNGNADYTDFLVRSGCEDAAVKIWHWLIKHRSLWDVIALHELPENSVAVRAIHELLLPKGLAMRLLQGEPCYRISLNEGDMGRWRERASKALQQQLKRRERQIFKKFDVRFHRITDIAEVPEAMAQLFALHRLRWGNLGQTGVFVFPKVRRFHIDFAQQALQHGWLRLHLLFLDGITAAAYYAFNCGDYAGFYTCGFHPAFSRYSVGKVLLAKVIDEAEREGVTVFDFMRGGESYKAEFGTVMTHNKHLFVWQKNKLLSRATAQLHRFTMRLALRIKHAGQR